MIKIDIAHNIAQELDLKDQEAIVIVDEIITEIKKTILERERLELRDFGVFRIKARKPRVGRNPKNKKDYPIPERKVCTFKVGKELKDIATELASQ